MKFSITVTLKKDVLDPQGKAVHQGLNKIGLNQIKDVRIGKKITLLVEAYNESEATKITEESCQKVLVNAVMETAEITVKELV